MYCPNCLNDTFSLANKGVVHLSINGKHKDSSVFLYNVKEQPHDEIKMEFENKLDELLKWYASFQNVDPIQSISIVSSDFICKDKECQHETSILNMKGKAPLYSVIGILLTAEEVLATLDKLSKKYNLECQIKRILANDI